MRRLGEPKDIKPPASSFFHEEARSLGVLPLTHIPNFEEVIPISNVSRRRRSNILYSQHPQAARIYYAACLRFCTFCVSDAFLTNIND